MSPWLENMRNMWPLIWAGSSLFSWLSCYWYWYFGVPVPKKWALAAFPVEEEGYLSPASILPRKNIRKNYGYIQLNWISKTGWVKNVSFKTLYTVYFHLCESLSCFQRFWVRRMVQLLRNNMGASFWIGDCALVLDYGTVIRIYRSVEFY